MVLVSRSYDEGWEAFIDGQRTEVLRADINLMALLIPAGEHEIHLKYFPAGFREGIAVFIVSIGILLGVRPLLFSGKNKGKIITND